MAKSDPEAKLGFVLEAMPMCLRGDLVVDCVDHRTCSECKSQGSSSCDRLTA